MTGYIIANFGGPRNISEVYPFLKALLTDPDVTGGSIPSCLHRPLFTAIAKLRANKVRALYESIGGGSPIFQDTEYLAQALRIRLHSPVLTFHRYLPATHKEFKIQADHLLNSGVPVTVLPLFPHFTYAVTGSIARFFSQNLDTKNLFWVKSFGTNPEFIESCVQHISIFLKNQDLNPKRCIFIFSVHGLPQSRILKGDPYEKECSDSFQEIIHHFPDMKHILCYQSQIGPAKWLSPYTSDICAKIRPYGDMTHAVIFPFGFLSDHLETLYEIEQLYLPKLRQNGFKAYRIPTLGKTELLCNVLTSIILTKGNTATEQLFK